MRSFESGNYSKYLRSLFILDRISSRIISNLVIEW